MGSPTVNKGLQYPAHGGAVNAWDTPINADLEILDLNLGGTLSVSLAAGSVVLSAANAQNIIYTLTGALPGAVTVQWPAIGGIYVVDNQTTGNFTVTLQTAGGGLTTTAPQGYRVVVVATNAGADMIPAVSAIAGNASIGGNLALGGNETVAGTLVVTGLATFSGGIALTTTQFPQGDCQFQYSSATVAKLVPYKGNQVTFPSGAAATLAAAGISTTISNAYLNGVAGQTLSINTLYYAYLWDSGGGTYVIDWSATGHSTDATTGIEIKTGDSTRVLVGMAYPQTGPNFVDGVTQRFVASWFNRQSKRLLGQFTVDRSIANGSNTEINSEVRVSFLSWADTHSISSFGSFSNGGSSGLCTVGLGLDGITGFNEFAQVSATNNGERGPLAIPATVTPTEGKHYATLWGNANSGTSQAIANSGITGIVII